jgi:transposase
MSAERRAAGPPPRSLTLGRRSLGLPGTGLAPWTNRRGDSAGVWCALPPESCRSLAQDAALESPKACSASPPAGRSEHGPLAPGDLAGHQQGAQAHGQSLFFIDASGFSALPSVVRTYAPVGHTPILKEWWTGDHLSAMSAISPDGKLSVHCQGWAINSADVVAFLEHLRREVPGRLGIMWDGAPMHRRHVIQECLAHGAAQRIHLERLPAYAPELNPGEGLWAHLTGVELRHVCGFNLTPLRKERRHAVKQVRRKPRILKGCFEGAKL